MFIQLKYVLPGNLFQFNEDSNRYTVEVIASPTDDCLCIVTEHLPLGNSEISLVNPDTWVVVK